MDNVFQKIINGELPAKKVYETDDVLAFLAIDPVNKGHTLVIPKKPIENIFNLSGDDAAILMKAIIIVSNAVKKGSNAPAINILSNNGSEAGQTVFHLHFHIIPSYKKGEVKAESLIQYENDEEMQEYADKISAEL